MIDNKAYKANNPYTNMQRKYYEEDAKKRRMLAGNHNEHDGNPDYWEILVKDTAAGFADKVGLDFGCGTGRNVLNLIDRFRRFDGADISQGLCEQAAGRATKRGYSSDRFNFYPIDGVSLTGVPSHTYDFVMSTITLQHISVWSIRQRIFEDMFRVMKKGGLLSIQMRFVGGTSYGVPYKEDKWDATETNGVYDVFVSDPDELAADIEAAGFSNVSTIIADEYPLIDYGPNPALRPQWIYLKAHKK